MEPVVKRFLLVGGVAGLLAACASTQRDNHQLEQAGAALQTSLG